VWLQNHLQKSVCRECYFFKVGFKTKLFKSLFEHFSISDAAVGHKEHSFILGSQEVERFHCTFDFLLTSPLFIQ